MSEQSWWNRLVRPAKWLWIWRLGMLLVLTPTVLLMILIDRGGGRMLAAWWAWCWLPVIAGGIIAMVGWYGCMAWWMARSPGGLRGWRFGLLLIPGVGLVWNWVESERIAIGVSGHLPGAARRGVRLSAAVASTLPMLCVIFAGGAIWRAMMGKSVDGMVMELGWGLLLYGCVFDVAAGMLNNCVRFREVEPYSSAKRRRELALVLGLGVVLPLALAAGWWGYWTGRIRVAVDRIAAAGLTETIPEELRPDIDPEAQAELKRLFEGVEASDLGYQYCTRWSMHVERRWRKCLAEYAERVAEFERRLDGEIRFDIDASDAVFLSRYYWIALRLADADGDREGVRANLKRLENLFVRLPGVRTSLQDEFGAGMTYWAAAGGLARLDDAALAWLRQTPLLRDLRLEYRMLAVDPAIVAFRDRSSWSAPWQVQCDAGAWESIAWSFENFCRDYWECDWSTTPEGPEYPHFFYRKFFQIFETVAYHPHHEVRRRAVSALIALETCRRATGGFPERLDELVPEFLDAVPVNPRDGAPAVYEIGEFSCYVTTAVPGRDERMKSYYGSSKPRSKDLTGELFSVTRESVSEMQTVVRLTFGTLSFTLPLEVEDE